MAARPGGIKLRSGYRVRSRIPGASKAELRELGTACMARTDDINAKSVWTFSQLERKVVNCGSPDSTNALVARAAMALTRSIFQTGESRRHSMAEALLHLCCVAAAYKISLRSVAAQSVRIIQSQPKNNL